jgi:16S rRNA (cytosine1402-N4)-methyltransferase
MISPEARRVPVPDWFELGEVEATMDTPVYNHLTVMRDEVVQMLQPQAGGVYVDCTLGGGGHSEAILQANPEATVIGIDRDDDALTHAAERLASFGERVRFQKACFSTLTEWLQESGIGQVDGLVADLGVSSPQLDSARRGLSFRFEGPLDMRMDPTSGETAAELIDSISVDELADIIYQYGEERRSRRIARCVKQAHDAGELVTTLDLRRAVIRAVGPARVGGVDPATRTFQALRIAVNRELDELNDLLKSLPTIMKTGGTIAIISFHSLEDRLVKHATHVKDQWQLINKKPLIATEDERLANPRSRSAKLRGARKLGPLFPDQVGGRVEEPASSVRIRYKLGSTTLPDIISC